MTPSHVTWLLHTWLDSFTRDMTPSHVTWLLHTWHDSFTRDMTPSHVTSLLHKWHDSFICVSGCRATLRRHSQQPLHDCRQTLSSKKFWKVISTTKLTVKWLKRWLLRIFTRRSQVCRMRSPKVKILKLARFSIYCVKWLRSCLLRKFIKAFSWGALYGPLRAISCIFMYKYVFGYILIRVYSCMII